MKKILLPLLLSLGGLGGCASHYYDIQTDHLHIYLKAEAAREVLFACSLDDFALRKAASADGETWEVNLPGKMPDEFRYFYMVDGTFFLPDCRYKEKDDFGTENCIFLPNM